MAASARMSTSWARRMGLVAAAFGVFAGWCVLDATVSYPRFNQRASEYNRLLAAGLAEQWPARAAQNQWPAGFKEDDHLPDGTVSLKTPWDIGTQYVMMTGCLMVVVVILYRLLRARGRTMQADDRGFRTIEGVLVAYADITEIDLRRWQRKSIARVYFRLRERRLSTDIDDWIYQGGEAVLAELQQRTGLGVPSAPPAGTAPPAPTGETHGKPDGSAA
jgi:hypothetical protein